MLDRLYGWYGKRVVRAVFFVVVALLVVMLFANQGSSDKQNANVDSAPLPRVEVKAVGDLQGAGSFSVVGTVRAISEARLVTEASGRVTSVRVGVGDRVSAGTILATIENGREQAAILQAEGAYEAALASAEGSDTDLAFARTRAREVHRNGFTVAEGVVRNLLDDFFSNPGKATTGFRLARKGDVRPINDARSRIEESLLTWSSEIATGNDLPENDLLERSEQRTNEVYDLTATIARFVSEEDPNTVFTEAALQAYKSQLEGARSSLNGTLTAITAARTGLTQAQIGASPDVVSRASAQLKSALGTLRSAQTNFEKTLIRTPIAGIVNVLNVREGEFVQPGQPAAVVANNGALEVTTALGEQDAGTVRVGDVVSMSGGATGTVTRVAPAIDPGTGKSEVRISVAEESSLKNGSAVTVTFSRTAENTTTGPLLVPLTALKFLADGPIVFSVNDEFNLVPHRIRIGSVFGNAVEVFDGISRETAIVTDARGLRSGAQVVVVTP